MSIPGATGGHCQKRGGGCQDGEQRGADPHCCRPKVGGRTRGGLLPAVRHGRENGGPLNKRCGGGVGVGTSGGSIST